MIDKSWEAFPADYRAEEIKTLAAWMAAGESGSVVGLPGCGRSNVLGYLCTRPEILQTYLPVEASPVAPVLIDLNNLPTNNLSTLYRTILRAFYQVRERFETELQQAILAVYLENRGEQDPFLTQSALYDILDLFKSERIRVILVLNRFDSFCQTATPQMLNTLRGLRDSFKNVLCYIVGMPQEVSYLPDPQALGEIYELLDDHVCWVGALNQADANRMIKRITATAAVGPTKIEQELMLALSGRFPALLREVILWWLTHPDQLRMRQAAELMLKEKNVRHRLQKIWNGLTQEEQLALGELQKVQVRATDAGRPGWPLKNLSSELKAELGGQIKQHVVLLSRLVDKGLCYKSDQGWWINGHLLLTYIAQVAGRSRGRIWLDQTTQELYQGQSLIEGLRPLQRSILLFFVNNPQIRFSNDDIIDNAWPDEDQREGITSNALQVQIRGLRKSIEPNPAKPRYLITWHGKPGGYQFFPEGRPDKNG